MLECNIPHDPINLFKTWLDQATEVGEHQPEAMCLTTVSKDLKPSARYVLMKKFDSSGFVFHTNYESKKSIEME